MRFRRLMRRLERFRAAREGFAAAEFALTLPLMVTLYFGVLTLSEGFALKQRLEFLGRTAGDLVSRTPAPSTGGNPVINATEITNVASASAALLAPYNPTGLKLAIAHVVVRMSGSTPVGRVCWSAARDVTGSSTVATGTVPAHLRAGQTVTVPEGFKVSGASYLITEVQHLYKPVVGHGLTGDITLKDVVPWPVRGGQQIVWQGQSPC